MLGFFREMKIYATLHDAIADIEPWTWVDWIVLDRKRSRSSHCFCHCFFPQPVDPLATLTLIFHVPFSFLVVLAGGREFKLHTFGGHLLYIGAV